MFRALARACFVAPVALLTSTLVLPQTALAAAAQSRVMLALAASPPPIDGTLGGSWAGAAHASLGWDFTHGRPAAEPTDVYITGDSAYLYVAFAAKQHDPIVATQQTNNVGEGSDDEVFVYLWPSGSNGFAYSFSANPRGTRYQSSSENTAYAPDWIARGTIGDGGYVVTMRIPLASIRGDGRGTWIAQFARRKYGAAETDEWSHDAAQTGPAMSIYAGALVGMDAVAKAARVQPRIGVYALADAAAASAGGPTTRAGADLSIPVTQTASILATIHPDYSNIERDQQTIAPTAFQRYYSEIRPFFTQTANQLDRVSCYGCPQIQELYTPGIPTPKRGYAFEGVQGQFSFAGFDAVGDGRIDTSSDVSYTAPSRRFGVAFDRTSADLKGTSIGPAIHDVVSTVSASFNDLRHFQGYIDYGHEQGSLVTSNAQRYETAVAWYTKDDFDSIALRKLGASYAPYDGAVALSDLAGYNVQANHTFHFSQNDKISTIGTYIGLDRYAGTGVGTDQYDFTLSATAVTKSKGYLSYNVGTSYTRLPGDILRPFTQTGGEIGYNPNTPTTTRYGLYVGRFADGYLSSTYRGTGFFVAKRTTVNLELDSTDWRGDAGTRAMQWLERASATYVIDRDSSFVIGARKITGAPPPIGALPQPVLGTNLTFAFSQRRKHDELYLVYGDASAFQTRPGAALKYIHYFGAQKGT